MASAKGDVMLVGCMKLILTATLLPRQSWLAGSHGAPTAGRAGLLAGSLAPL